MIRYRALSRRAAIFTPPKRGATGSPSQRHMKFEHWRTALQWPVAIVFVLAVVASVPVLATDADTWKVYENGYFKAFSNAEESDALEILRDLEIFRLVSTQLSPVYIPEGALKTLAVIFRTRREFKQHSPQNQVLGYATFSKNLGIIVSSSSDRGIEARHVIRHEFVHILQLYHQARLPNWYREGLAEVLSAVDIQGREFTVGELPGWRRNRLSKVVSYKKIVRDDFDLTKQSIVTTGADTYWQCWLLTHYLLFGADDNLKRKFVTYLTLYNEGVRSEDAFTQAFGFESAQLWPKHLKAYASRVPTYRGYYDRNSADTEFSIENAAASELRAILGFLIERSSN